MSLLSLPSSRRTRFGWLWLWIGLGVLALVGGGIGLLLALPRLETVSPSPDGEGLSTRPSIRLTFNQPMNTASVEQAFTVNPPVAGQFSWRGNMLIFTPLDPWPLNTEVQVALQGGQGANGLPLLNWRSWTFTIGERRLLFLAGAPTNNVWVLSLADEAQASAAETQAAADATQTAVNLLTEVAPEDITPASVAPANTVRPEPVTTEPEGVFDFALSPDGTEIVYAVWRADGGTDLRRVDLAGTNPADVLLCPGEACLAPAFSPDGNQIAYQRHVLFTSPEGEVTLGPARLYIFDRTTGEDTLQSDPASDARAPRWGPHGELAYLDPAQQIIIVLSPATGQSYAFPTQAGVMGTWDATGAALIYPELGFLPVENTPTATPNPLSSGEVSANNPQPFYTYLVRWDAATHISSTLSGVGVVNDTAPVFSPAGDWLAFARLTRAQDQWAPGRQLWLMRPDGTEAHPLTDDPLYNHSAFRWSPDGSALVYTRFNTGEPGTPTEIWYINADGTDAHRLATGYLPQWVP